MTLGVAATRELLALNFASISPYFAYHSASPATSANQLGSRAAITWDSVTTVTVLPGTSTPANKVAGANVSIALAATTAAPIGAYWSASTAGVVRQEVTLNIPSGSARNVDTTIAYYQA